MVLSLGTKIPSLGSSFGSGWTLHRTDAIAVVFWGRILIGPMSLSAYIAGAITVRLTQYCF